MKKKVSKIRAKILAMEAKLLQEQEELRAIEECRRKNPFPLFKILTERPPSPRFAADLCLSLARMKPGKFPKYLEIGQLVVVARRKHPRRTLKETCNAVAAELGLSAETGGKRVQKYYERRQKLTKPVRQETDLLLSIFD